MNALLIKRVVFVLLCLFSIGASAQTSAVISGKLVDATTNKPLDFATVSLLRKPGNQPVKGLQTDLNGNFKLTGITEGTYLLRISFVSYLSFTKDSITITAGSKGIQLGTIKMRQAKGLLKEVVVTSQRSQIQLSTDKKIFSVDQSLVSQGGSATDLLSSVPSVQVDVEGNVNLRGSDNVRVLINGKPSALTGGNMADILQSLPASSIESIEVITNPSSKYDAEGQSGIINIVLKKNARIGFNGSASISAGNQESVAGSLNLNYQTQKFNFYTNYSYRKARRSGENNYDRTNLVIGSTGITYQDQQGTQTYDFRSHNIRAGIDYNINSKTTLSLSNNINTRNFDRYQTGLTLQSDANRQLLRTVQQNNLGPNSGFNNDLNLDFSKKFKKPQQELTANIGYSTASNDNMDSLRTYYRSFAPVGTLNSLQNNNNHGKQRNLNLQADYTLPLNKDSRIEMGYRSTFNTNDNSYLVDTALRGQANNFIFADSLSRNFNYKEQVHAVYGTYQQQFGKIGVQVGARLEDARIRTETITTGKITPYKQDYFRVYPSVFLSDKLTDKQTIQLSYTRRIQRPRDREISPFLDRSDRQNYQQGNPSLLPEDTHAFELSYINYIKALTVTSSLYYRLTNNDISQVRTRYNDTVTLTRFENINTSSNAGYELIARLTASQNLDLTGNFNAFYRHLQGDLSKGISSNSGFSYNANLTVNYKPVKKLGVQVRGEYEGKRVTTQGYIKPVLNVEGGVRYDLTSKLNLSVNSRDIFNTRKYTSVSSDAAGTFTQTSMQRRSFRSIMFTLAYRFGGNTQARERNRNKNGQDQGSDDGGLGGNGVPSSPTPR